MLLKRHPDSGFLHAWLTQHCAAGRTAAVCAAQRAIIPSRLQQAECPSVFTWAVQSNLSAEGKNILGSAVWSQPSA